MDISAFDFVVVGAGLAGAIIAERIANVLGRKVLIIERRSHVGGNCYDYIDESGIIVHKYGPHIFHTDYEEVYNYISKFTEWLPYTHKVLVSLDGNKVPLPFNFTSMEIIFSRTYSNKLQEKLLRKFKYDERVPLSRLANDSDEDIVSLSQFIFKKIFQNYSIKQWGKSVNEMEDLVYKRVPVVIGRDDRYFSDKYQGIPKESYSAMFRKLLSSPNIEIFLNTDFKKVSKIINDEIFIFDKPFNGKLIFTGMVDELFDYKFGKLSYRSLGLDLKKVDVNYFQEVATINYPNEYEFTRITEFKRMKPVQVSRTIILKEYPVDYLTGINEPFYPVFTENERKKYYLYFDYAKKFSNLILLGRLAEFKYYDMDDVILSALKVFRESIESGQ